jgi:hypothetical protein
VCHSHVSSFLGDFLSNTAHLTYSPSKAKDGDMVSVYSVDPIAQNPTVSLSVPRMVLIAILSGGDYDKVMFPFLLLSRRCKLI